ncbi:DNA cytosine methyltransferase [Paenibacillus sp. Y412MC10]|uniref:DNA cytosine methyltransferase n=1 Tax=Geobacillus sp. (strain Y412MC10) TaxID=481743 RepID=UPI0011AB3185|nr:DNA cytosine methyltransferase [Paenibacillus sp. Y412MC10]
MLKSRKAKLSNRGVYLQDRALQETVFQPGSHYRYVIDQKSKQIIILASEDVGDNTVSRRVLKNSVKPVIDIRDREALSAFEGCEYLQVDIYGDRVVVQGFEAMKATPLQKVTKTAKQLIGIKRKVVDIRDILAVKKKSEIVMSRKSLQKAAGSLGYEQLEFDLFFGDSTLSDSRNAYLQPALSNLEIPLQVSSLFSGAGIMDLGAIEAGFKVIFALELSEGAVETYRHNLGNHILHGDITKIDKAKQILKAPVMIGGSPCQGFSNSNRYTNFLDNPNNMLVKHYIEAVRSNENCKVFVLENVPRILTAGGGKFKNEIYEALSDFEISSGVISSADYGSPQIRDRAVFIGSKIGKIDLPKPTFSRGSYRTVRDAFQGLHNGIPNQMDISSPKEITIERMSNVPPGGNVFDIPEAIRPSGQHSDMYKRLQWDKPSITIVNPRKACITHPEENRILSVRECARLFDVRDDFVFKGDLGSRQQQIANAVPVRLTKSIMNVVRTAIERFNANLRAYSGLQLV